MQEAWNHVHAGRMLRLFKSTSGEVYTVIIVLNTGELRNEDRELERVKNERHPMYQRAFQDYLKTVVMQEAYRR